MVNRWPHFGHFAVFPDKERFTESFAPQRHFICWIVAFVELLSEFCFRISLSDPFLFSDLSETTVESKKEEPQYLHLMASLLISSVQCGHGILEGSANTPCPAALSQCPPKIKNPPASRLYFTLRTALIPRFDATSHSFKLTSSVVGKWESLLPCLTSAWIMPITLYEREISPVCISMSSISISMMSGPLEPKPQDLFMGAN